MTFEQLLLRADEDTIGELLGKEAIKLIGILAESAFRLGALRDILLSLHSPEELLLSAQSRVLLIDLMPIADAHRLTQALDLNVKDEYAGLKATKFPRNSWRANTLLNFFGLLHPQDEELDAPPSTRESAAQYALFKHQRIAARKTTAILEENGRVLLHMPTGSGKTRTAMNIACEHLRRHEPGIVVWFAFSEELCEQAASEFEKSWTFLGNRTVNVHRLWGNVSQSLEEIQDGIVIAGLAKLGRMLDSSPTALSLLGSRTTLLIMDEAHQAIAPTYSLLLEAFYNLRTDGRLLGLSATPGRTWNDVDDDQRLANFFGGRKVTLEVEGYDNPVRYLIEEGYLARAKFEQLHYTPGIELSNNDIKMLSEKLDVPESLLGKLALDQVRNLTILNKIEEMVLRHERIIVFASNVAHAELLATVLRARGIQGSSVTGNTSSSARARIIAEFKDDSIGSKVLCNYGVLTTGFDAPKTSAAIIARPTKSLVLYSQMVGRAIRGTRAGGNDEAEIVTVVDFNLPGFNSIEDAFINWEDVWTN
ncbi:DEAD/DEAH box helicase [Hymenobacter sp. BT770]|uniref:DEAD/DEAH box helicase n=1 Tax=Hymenobacter sp. BT770 TaxID=2886942 RepID=UPI001D110A58|nr:DEAD/DEAH box helicase [Hymenobacter sp. BT770]MCC3154612.1 DEAD/DEAH box helicase [Hymenobacter sp. BT770]MDO3416666.1 DEAD/DEAH box helicase [Hymenobacter sp. BT770]